MKSFQQRGFTLYELLITLVMIGIVISIGVPNLSAFTQNSRITGTANDLHSSFHLARSEAARSKDNITICASTNSMDAGANCSGDFNDGWIIFIDTNGDIDRSGADENVIRAHPPVPDELTITADDAATYFSFSPAGLGRGDVDGPSLVRARICDGRGNDHGPGGNSTARILVVTPLGRATVLRDFDQIEAAGGCP